MARHELAPSVRTRQACFLLPLLGLVGALTGCAMPGPGGMLDPVPARGSVASLEGWRAPGILSMQEAETSAPGLQETPPEHEPGIEEDPLPMDEGDSDAGSDGAAGSNPLASVTKVDLIWNYYETTNDRDVHDFNVKASTMLHPRIKLNVELHYWATDLTGSNERDWESLSIKPIWFVHDRKLGEKWGMRIATGAEYIVDFNNWRKGIGLGTDQFGPLVGLAFMNMESKTVLIPLIQHFEDVGSGPDVSTTALRFIALQPFPGGVWAKADIKLPRDWENHEWPASGELEVGKMLSSRVGLLGQGLAGMGGDRVFDWGTALGIRVNF